MQVLRSRNHNGVNGGRFHSTNLNYFVLQLTLLLNLDCVGQVNVLAEGNGDFYDLDTLVTFVPHGENFSRTNALAVRKPLLFGLE